MMCNCHEESCKCKSFDDNLDVTNNGSGSVNLTTGNSNSFINVNTTGSSANNNFGTTIGFGIGNNSSVGTSTLYQVNMYSPKKLIDVEVNNETIMITYVQRAMFSYTTTYNTTYNKTRTEDRVFKEIYGVKDGKLVLLNTIYGVIIPPKLEETYEFPE